MNEKKLINKTGCAIAPVTVGKPALLICGEESIRTSPVAAVIKDTGSRIMFETQNSIYDIKLEKTVGVVSGGVLS